MQYRAYVQSMTLQTTRKHNICIFFHGTINNGCLSQRTKLKFCDGKRLSLPLLQIWKCIFSCILVNDKQKFFGLSTVTRETLKVTSRFIINPTKSCYCIYQLCSITTLMDFAHKPFHKKDIDTYYI